MAKSYRTALIIDGDARGGIRAVKATGEALDRFDRKQRRSRTAATAMAKSWRHLENNAARYSAGIALITTGSIALAARQAKSATEADNLARSLDVSTQSLMEWQYAGERVGINAEKMGDIFKDTSDKLGDFIATGGGEAADMFENLNLNIAELRRMKPDEQLIRIGEAIGEVGDRSQQVFYLESIADDASRLLPLLENNAAQLKAFKQEARDFGLSLGAEDIAQLRDANSAMMRLRSVTEGLANEFSIALAPSIERAADEAVDLRSVFRDESFRTGVSAIADATVTMATGLADSVREIGRLKTAIDDVDLSAIGGFLASRTGPGYLLGKMGYLDGEDGGASGSWAKGATGSWGEASKPSALDPIEVKPSPYSGLLDDYDQAHAKLMKLRAARDKLNHAIEQDPANASGYRRALAEVNRQITQMGESGRTAASKLTSAYDTLKGQLGEQIALADESSQVAQTRYQIEQGGLRGLSDARAANLLQMSAEIDQLNAQKTAVQALFPEWQKLQQASRLRQSVLDLPPDMQAFGQRRATQMAGEAATEGLPGMQGLAPEFNGPFGEVDRLEGERAQYEEKYQQRLEAFQEFARTHQDQKADADSAIEALEADHQQRMQQYDDQTHKARRLGYQSTYNDLTSIVGTFAGEQSAIYQGMFAASKAFAIADSTVQIAGALSKAANNPFPANLAFMATVAAQTASIVSTISSTTMSGQAHDGIDNVPNTGTWNLERGERVIDRRTNVDLKQYLQRENGGAQQQRGGGSVTIPVNITVEAKPGVSDEDARRQGAEIGRAFKENVEGVLVNHMRPGGMLENVKRSA